MIISHKLKAMFVHNHRTGGTTIANLLRKHSDGKFEEISQHGNIGGAERELLDRHPDYFVFGFVRNPWDRLRSWFNLIESAPGETVFETDKKVAFESFLSGLVDAADYDFNFHLNQLNYFTDRNGILRADKIGRFETFEADVSDIFQNLGQEISEISSLNQTGSNPYRDYYTPATKALVEEKCSADIATFGYKF